ncbi:MAG: tetratricopeptide repeat protein [Planctomycetota bacterium]
MKCRDRAVRWGWAAFACLCVGPVHAQGVEPATPPEPNPLVERVLSDPLTDADELARRRVFHGRFVEHDLLTPWAQEPAFAADLALARWRLDDPALGPAARAIDPAVRATAALRRGRPESVKGILAGPLSDPDLHPARQLEARLLYARASVELNDLPAAVGVLDPVRGLLISQRLLGSAEFTHAAEAILLLARLQGRPGDDYQTALELLRRAREADPLDWRPRLVEGRLLAEKDNRGQGAEALAEVLSLNPAQAQAWYELGRLNVESFNFDGAAAIAARLNQLTPDHPLAALLEARSLIHQKDPRPLLADGSVLNALIERYPTHREALSLKAAAAAIAYEAELLDDTLAELDRLSPGTPLGHLEVGLALSHARQYPQAEHHLREAVSRQPNDAAPRVALGLLLMQAGTLDQAHAELALANALDPFNRYAGNSLTLVEELLGWETIETDHFVIRYKPGIDAALAADMPAILESLYADVTAEFGHEPDTKTQIDLMPDEQYFGVRIAGLPEIWTIAAATGPVIAMTPPRQGPHQRGTFDVANVLRHEFVHTVNLSQTRNRIPHWFTEACAVSVELTGRTFQTQQLLAAALAADDLFDLEEINWAFVRPKKPTDRGLAYAQANWMLEYIELRFGWEAVLDMLDRYRDGQGDRPTLEAVTGMTAESFMDEFKAWAYDQVAVWGLDEAGDPAAAPGNPLRLRATATLALDTGDVPTAIAALERLDAVEGLSGAFAHQLAELHAQQGDLARAAFYAERALHREPYNADYRTTAATLNLRAGNADDALRHLAALTVLEPTQSIHHVRLAAMRHRQGDVDGADSAARAALEIDPDAPVEAFLKPE